MNDNSETDDEIDDNGRRKFLWQNDDIEVVKKEPAKPPPKPAKSESDQA